MRTPKTSVRRIRGAVPVMLERPWPWLAPRLSSLLAPLLVLVGGSSLPAVTCTVPGSHPTIQAAVDDPTCTQIDLADQTYTESVRLPRSLDVVGPSVGTATVEGRVLAIGASTLVTLTRLEVRNGCDPEALAAKYGARIEGTDLVVERAAALPCPPLAPDIFADDFESGDTGAWTGTVP